MLEEGERGATFRWHIKNTHLFQNLILEGQGHGNAAKAKVEMETIP